MSKTSKRKTGDSTKGNISSSSKDYQKRPSVFERLGTKASINSTATTSLSVNISNQESFCRNWAQSGSCPYGKSCKLSSTHTLVSPSKRSSKKEVDSKQVRSEEKRVHSNLNRRVSPEVNWETWDQTDLEYEDEKALEKRRQLLQRELEIQMKKETRKQDPAKRRCSSTSSCTSSSSGSSSSTGSTSESSVSTLRRNELKKKRQSTSSPSGSERNLKKNMVKTALHKDSPARKSTGTKKVSPPRKASRRKSPSPPPRKPLSPPKQKLPPTLSGSTSTSGNRRRDSPPGRRGPSLERKSNNQHRSTSRNRRGRSPKSRPRPRTPESKSSSRALPLPPSSILSARNRSGDRKKDDDRKGSKDDSGRRERKSDFRDKRDQDDDRRSREKAREIREAAREKERLEALERCRERQREREQLAKEKERAREERERERAKRERERRDRRGSSRERRRPPATTDDKRHDRIYDSEFTRYERKIGERERSYERDRVRDRALERVIERKSADRNRDRSRESYDRPYESRRIIQEEKPYSSPFRGGERGRNNYDTERERDRVGSQEVRSSAGYSSAGESDRRSRRDRQTWESSAGSYQDSQRDKREWEQRDYHEPSREWDNRSRCRGEEGGDEWAGYSGGVGGTADWHGGRSHMLPLSHHEERRIHTSDINEKDHPLNDLVKEKDQTESNKRLSRNSGDEMEDITKRPRVEESISLQEELSDISDDADDILNREDVEFEDPVVLDDRRTNGTAPEEESETSVNDPPANQSHDETTAVCSGGGATLTDDEHLVNLDFEEISDDELEEESKVNKGSSVGDALGVDWASLMAECRPQRKPQVSSAHTYWSTANIFARIGISFNMTTPHVYNSIKEKYNLSLDNEQELHLAGLHRAISEKRQRRSALVSSVLEHKQALSARSDISVRRQLCGLPVVSLESHQTAGFCQWAV